LQELAPQPSGTRRERQIQRKRREILAAATQVFSEKGYASTTTKDIANQADIGESTLYSYFDSKRDILLAIFNENHLIFDALFLNSNTVANRTSLVSLFERSIEIFTSHLLLTRTILSEAWVDNEILNEYVLKRLKEISQILEDFIRGQIEAGIFRGFDPSLGARLAMGMFFSLVLPALRGIEPPPTPDQRRELSEAVVSLMLDGIRTRKGESA
jgi:AcrR family transcriptional regulator